MRSSGCHPGLAVIVVVEREAKVEIFPQIQVDAVVEAEALSSGLGKTGIEH